MDVQKATEMVADVMSTSVGIHALHLSLFIVMKPNILHVWHIECVEIVDDSSMAAANEYGMSKHKWSEKDSHF